MTTENGTTHTHQQIDGVSESLLEWAKKHRNVLAVAAMLGEDDETHYPHPEAIVAGAMSELKEGDVVALLVQLQVAVQMTIDQIAMDAEMGEEAFRRMFKTLLNHMLDAAGVTQADQIESDSQTSDTNTRKEIK
tara:strand:+ start:323 stop:724 length:402 start_codon:yes stop_codon:yes gene_type:complete